MWDFSGKIAYPVIHVSFLPTINVAANLPMLEDGQPLHAAIRRFSDPLEVQGLKSIPTLWFAAATEAVQPGLYAVSCKRDVVMRKDRSPCRETSWWNFVRGLTLPPDAVRSGDDHVVDSLAAAFNIGWGSPNPLRRILDLCRTKHVLVSGVNAANAIMKTNFFSNAEDRPPVDCICLPDLMQSRTAPLVPGPFQVPSRLILQLVVK
jgi:hypothetical protein